MQVENWEVSDPYAQMRLLIREFMEEIRGRVRDLAQRFRAEKAAAV